MNGIQDRVNKSTPRAILEELANRLVLAKTQPEEIPIILALCKAAWKKYPESPEVSYETQLLLDNALKDARSLLLISELNNEDPAGELADFSSSIIGGLYLISIFESFEASGR
ncbi:MAG: hypothetical protein NTX14_04275 [Candidatus Nealsonbacteria bacterium]|nr:hypothetical protein [Candidatus Nealsonbacteria bacterium]